jgi:two-component system, OmpR family, sensor kinase
MLEATAGRRLLLRIWTHGVVLFVGVVLIVLTARFVMARRDPALAARAHPEFTLGIAERALAVRGDPAALAVEIEQLRGATSILIGVFGADGAALAPTTVRPASPRELSALAPRATYTHQIVAEGDRFVVGAYRGDTLDAVAVAVTPPMEGMWIYGLTLWLVSLGLALLVVAVPLTRSIVRPLERLRALSRELGAGNLAVRASAERRDEIGDLARAFNHMAAQIQGLRAAERELLADVSHELRTPLARMRVVLDLASDADPAAVRRYLREITTDLSELEQLIDHIITSSRLDSDGRWAEARAPLQCTPLDVGELVEAALLRFGDRWPERTFVNSALPSPPLVVAADPVMLRRAIDNLVDNARKYSPDDKPITVTVSRTELQGSPAARVEVVDEGIGIAAEDHASVFTAFFRADKSRTRGTGGVGLGLALARRIVEGHRGIMGFTSERDRGSRFWLVLPLESDTGRELTSHPALEGDSKSERGAQYQARLQE